MSKLVLSDIDNESVPAASTTINSNNSAIETAFENTLSRDGTGPNQMEANLDMNSNRILNLPAARQNVDTDVVRVGDLSALVAVLGVQGPPGPTGDGSGDVLASNNLSELTDPSAARTNLGLQIGVNVQAFDALLAALADLSVTTDEIIFATGANEFSTTSLSSFVRTILDDPDAASVRTTIGLSPAASAAFGTSSGEVCEGNDSRFSQVVLVPRDSSSNFLLSDQGKLVRHTSGLAHTFTIPPSTFPVGAVIQLRNSVGGGAITIARGAGVSLYLAGSTSNSNRTLSNGGFCTLLQEDTNIWVVSGSGLL